MKSPLTPAVIEPATLRFVAQHLNHCATAVPIYIYIYIYLKKAYDSGRREVLYNILIGLRVDKHLSDVFPIKNR